LFVAIVYFVIGFVFGSAAGGLFVSVMCTYS
jgi:hypothetical protein